MNESVSGSLRLNSLIYVITLVSINGAEAIHSPTTISKDGLGGPGRKSKGARRSSERARRASNGEQGLKNG